MRLSFTTIHDIPDEIAEEYVNLLRHRGLPGLDPDILKNKTQIMNAEAEFFKVGDSENPIKIPLVTIIEAGTLQ